MAVQSDFRIIAVNEYIGTDPSALNTDFPFVGESRSVKHFQIDGVPVDDAYLLISHSRFRLTWHAVKINNRDLPWIEIFPSQEASTNMAIIPAGFLARGLNTLQIAVRGAAVIVYHVVVHWREHEARTQPPIHPIESTVT
jgi:hypothetical protein